MTQQNRNSRLQEEIDRNLKRAYEDVLQQEVPDRFKELLAQLKKTQGAAPSGGDNHDS